MVRYSSRGFIFGGLTPDRTIRIRRKRVLELAESTDSLLVRRPGHPEEEGWGRGYCHQSSVVRIRIDQGVLSNVYRTGSIQERARTMHETLQQGAAGRSINFIAHSMGGLDCRELISNIQPKEYTPLTLTTVSTPHRGSPFMDWLMVRCNTTVMLNLIFDRKSLA